MASGGLQDAAFLRNFHQYFENLPQGDKARIARLMSLHKTIGYKNYSPSRNIYCNNLGFSRLIPGTNQPVFNQTPKFYNQIQMLAPMADCVCGPKNTGPASISHMCCGRCKMGADRVFKSDQRDFKNFLAGFDFNETDISIRAEQILNLLNEHIPISIYVYSRAQHVLSGQAGLTTFFFKSIESLHAFVLHLMHSVTQYINHENFLHASLFETMRNGEVENLTNWIRQQANHQYRTNALHKYLMRGYQGGGVGVGYVNVVDLALNARLKEDIYKATEKETCSKFHNSVGVYFDLDSEDVVMKMARLELTADPNDPRPGRDFASRPRMVDSSSFYYKQSLE